MSTTMYRSTDQSVAASRGGACFSIRVGGDQGVIGVCRDCGRCIRLLTDKDDFIVRLELEPSDSGDIVVKNGVAALFDPTIHKGRPRFVAHAEKCTSATALLERGINHKTQSRV